MKFCPECGAKVEGMKFCPECGCNLDEKDTDNSKKSIQHKSDETITSKTVPDVPIRKRTPKKKWLVIIIIIIFIGALAVGIQEMMANPEQYSTDTAVATTGSTQNKKTTNFSYLDLATKTIQGYEPKANIHQMDYKEWEVDGVIYIESGFDINDIEHKFLIRCSKDKTQVFILKVDGETVISDQEKEIEYMDKQNK